MDDSTHIIPALMKSGFPLQARVEHEIHARTASGWKVLGSEVPWLDADNREQFIDLIACCGRVVPVIECKKAQERSLVFLRPVGAEKTGRVKTFSGWCRDRDERSSNVLRDDIELEPASYRAAFCVTTDRDKAGQRLLEPDARTVMLAADSVLGLTARHSSLPRVATAIPVIVTTASLYTLRFKPIDVALESGEFTLDAKQITEQVESIPWVRFHKTLSARYSVARTVFVVSAAALPDFLDEIASEQARPAGVA